MTQHLTQVRNLGAMIQATCPEHRAIGIAQKPTRQGWNAVETEARAHDDIMHGVYRSESLWRQAIGVTDAR